MEINLFEKLFCRREKNESFRLAYCSKKAQSRLCRLSNACHLSNFLNETKENIADRDKVTRRIIYRKLRYFDLSPMTMRTLRFLFCVWLTIEIIFLLLNHAESLRHVVGRYLRGELREWRWYVPGKSFWIWSQSVIPPAGRLVLKIIW